MFNGLLQNMTSTNRSVKEEELKNRCVVNSTLYCICCGIFNTFQKHQHSQSCKRDPPAVGLLPQPLGLCVSVCTQDLICMYDYFFCM